MSLATMSVWHDVDRHPWYAPAALKRKHSDSEDDEDTAETFLRGSSHSPDSDNEHSTVVGYPTPPPETALLSFPEAEQGVYHDGHSERKRRRYGEIERRMAKMQIAPGMAPSMSASSEASWYTAGSTSPVVRANLLDAYAVEEPSSPGYDERQAALPFTEIKEETPLTHEVRMRGAEPAWYEREKDRIVVTDIDEAAEEDEYKSEAEPHPDASEYAECNADYSISSVLLEHIKRQANFPYVPPSNDNDARKGATEEEIKEEEKREEDRRTATDGVHIEEIDEGGFTLPPPPGGYVTGTVSEVNDGYEPMDMDVDP